MTIEEKIKLKKEQIEQARELISRTQERIAKLQRDIELLEASELKGILKEINMPFDEVRELLRDLRSEQVAAPVPQERGEAE